MLGFNRKILTGLQGKNCARHEKSVAAGGETRGTTVRPGESRLTKSHKSFAPLMNRQKQERGDRNCPREFSKISKDRTFQHQKRCRGRGKWGSLEGKVAENDVQISIPSQNSSKIMANARKDVKIKKHVKSPPHEFKQVFRESNSLQSSEGSSDSVAAIGSPIQGSGLSKNRAPVNSNRDELPWNAEDSEDVRDLEWEQKSDAHQNLAEMNTACGKKEDRLLDELNFHVRNMDKSEPVMDESRESKEFLLSPARLCTFGLSEGSEVLRGVEKARQEMICEMEALERDAPEQSDSSVHEPKKGEDPEGWARWQEAKRLLKKIKRQERQLIGSGSSAQFTDMNYSADMAGIGTENSMLESALDAEIHVSSQDENMTGIYNMTFKNLAAGLLELVRRRTGLNSSSESHPPTNQTENDGSQSRTDLSDLSLISHDSGMVVEKNEEEGVTRWVDATDASTLQSTPAWKRIGRSKRNLRSAQCAEKIRDDVTSSVKNLFAEDSDNQVPTIPCKGVPNDSSNNDQTEAARTTSTPSWKRLGRRKRVARTLPSTGILHNEIIDSIQNLFPAPSEEISAQNITFEILSRDARNEVATSFLTPSWKRIGRTKRICRADKLAGNTQRDKDDFVHDLLLAPHSPRQSGSNISMPKTLSFHQRSNRECMSSQLDHSIPLPLSVSRSACKARPFSRSVELSALNTISMPTHRANLDDGVTMGQYSPVKQGMNTIRLHQAEHHNDEVVTTPVKVKFLLFM